MEVLVVVDMQKDFVTGALGTPEAKAVVPAVCEKIKSFEGRVIFTRDTHQKDYPETEEGRHLPVPHCIEGSDGWELVPPVAALAAGREIINKPTFGSRALGRHLEELDAEEPVTGITLIGLCTDICVISNALLVKAFLPNVPITVDAACCAGVTPGSHCTALDAMRACQINIENG